MAEHSKFLNYHVGVIVAGIHALEVPYVREELRFLSEIACPFYNHIEISNKLNSIESKNTSTESIREPL